MIPLLGPNDPFPPVHRALDDPNGLLAAGGTYSPWTNLASRVDTALLGPLAYQFDLETGRGHDPDRPGWEAQYGLEDMVTSAWDGWTAHLRTAV